MNILFVLFFYVAIITNDNVTCEKLENVLNLSLKNIYNYVNVNNYIKLLLRDQKSEELCMQQIQDIQQGLINKENWALEFIDAWGKIPSGILWGHLSDMGNFDECLNATKPIKLNTDKILKGKYCTARVPIGNLLSIKNNPSIYELQRFGGLPPQSPSIMIGICIPNSCDAEDFNSIIKNLIENILGIQLDEMDEILGKNSCAINYQEQPYQTIDIFAICLFSIIGLIMALSTIYDYFIQHVKGAQPNNLLAAFSVYTNGKKLFKIPVKKTENMIGCLNGIRCLSMTWVIIGHRYAIGSAIPFINSIKILDWYSTAFSLLLQNASVAVDSFFLLSGLLISWIGFRELEKSKGKLNIIGMYFHRYIRLTPVLAILILGMVSLFKYTATGPYWSQFNSFLLPLCEKNWWHTLLYVQNYASPNEMCLLHSWYLAVDTQLYLISPFLLLLTWKWGKKFIYPTSIILILLSIGCCFTTFLKYEFSLTRTQPQNQEVEKRRNQLIYFPTHTRISPWFVGFVLGYFMHENRGKCFTLSKIIVFVGWLISFTTIAAIIFGTYPRVQPGSIATPLEGAFYESMSRFSWALALAWIIFACHNGYGGIINYFLSYPLWHVLSRLTYSMYLIHLLVILYNIGSSKTSEHFSNYEVQFMFLGDFCITIFLSVAMVLAFESPILGIEKSIFGKGQRIIKNNNISQ